MNTADDIKWSASNSPVKLYGAVIFRDFPLRGLRTFPQRKKRHHKKEQNKRDANIVAVIDL